MSSPAGILVAGGLDAANRTTPAVFMVDVATGGVRLGRPLAQPSHDAAAAMVPGGLVVLGGGTPTTTDVIQSAVLTGQSRVLGALPQPRSDGGSARIGDTTYLVGGYDGRQAVAEVLATTDGTGFRTVAALPVPVRYPAVAALDGMIWVLGGEHDGAPTSVVQRVDPTTGRASVVGSLPTPRSDAAAVVLGSALYVVGGRNGSRHLSDVLAYDPRSGSGRVVARLPVPLSDAMTVVVGTTAYVLGGETPATVDSVFTLTAVPVASAVSPTAAPSTGTLAWLDPPTGPSMLTPGSDPSVLPGPILIADKLNNRLVVVDPQGRVRWQFPRPGDLAPGQTFRVPDDAFFSPDGTKIVATQEDDFAVSVIDIATHRIVFRYGVPGHPGHNANHLDNPDDALMLPGGDLLMADIRNCRVVLVPFGAHTPARAYGQPGSCMHRPPSRFGSPNGAFPMSNGHYLVTEIQGDWVDEMAPGGKVFWAAHPPGVSYPSDTNEVRTNVYLTVDYTSPGQVLTFDSRGRLLWRYRPLDPVRRLDHPSLALPLPNGMVLVTDDRNHRVIVVDPRTGRIVWQYGHLHRPGRAPGFLDNPDGLDLLPPFSLVNP